MKQILFSFIFCLTSFLLQAQISITSAGTPFTENFDAMGSSTTATISAGFKIGPDWATGTTAVTRAAGTSGAGIITGTSSGGIYNWANGVTATATDRALGFLTSGSFTSPQSISVRIINNTGSIITDINVSFDYEKYRSGTREFTWSFFHGNTSNPTIAAPTGNNFYPADANNTTVFNPPAVISKTVTITGLNIAAETDYYLKWTYTGTGGSSNGQGTGIDNFVITANGTSLPPCAEPTAQPTNLILTPGTTTVNGSFTLIPPATTVMNYLVVRSPAALTALPADGEIYDPGETVNGGNGIAVEINTDGSFTDIGLNPDTDYFYTVFAIEDQGCSGGPNYNQASPPTGSTHTNPPAPCTPPGNATGLTFTATNTTISGTFTAPAPPANRYLVIRNTTGTGAFTGTITDGVVYTPGTVIGNGTVVSYLPGLSFTATGLTINTAYEFYIFPANTGCTGEPDYNTNSLNGVFSTANNTTGIPPGYYNSAAGLTCGSLKTALFNIIKPTSSNPAPDYDGICTIYPTTDFKVSDFGAYNVIWDMYSDNPTGPDPYEFEYGIDVDGCGGMPNNTPFPNGEGEEYNREHSFPRSWFGGQIEPMNSDIMHIFPTDKKVNAVRNNFPYGEIAAPTFTSLNGSMLGPNSTPGYNGIAFEPINEYKGDFARAHLYMITAYEDLAISANWAGNSAGTSTMNDWLQSSTDQPNAAARKLQILDDWYMQLMYKWNNQDPVSQKEIDRNNAVYAIQGNRNPFVDHPEYVAAVFSCSRALPVNLLDFTAQKNSNGVILKWIVASETSFKKYDVERSTNGSVFNKIGEVNAANLSAYSFTDNNLPTAAVVYYRLKMVDVDDVSKVSKIVPVRLVNNLSNAIVYPNPTKDNLNIRLYESLQSNSTLQVMDVTGRIVKSQTVAASQINISLDVKNLPAGRYFVKIANNAQVINQSFVVMQ